MFSLECSPEYNLHSVKIYQTINIAPLRVNDKKMVATIATHVEKEQFSTDIETDSASEAI